MTFVRLFLLQIPLAWIGLRVAGYSGILGGVVCAELASSLLGWLWMHRQLALTEEPSSGSCELGQLSTLACEMEETI